MSTTQISVIRENSYVQISFETNFIDIDSETYFDFSEFSILLATSNQTSITCESCSADFNISTAFYTIDNSVAFCVSHLPTALLNEIKIIL